MNLSNRKIKKSSIWMPALAALLTLQIICTGCQTADPLKPTKIDDFDYTTVINNHLTLMDLAYHLKNSGINVVSIQPLLPTPINAAGAASIKIDNDEVGIYYFNTDVEQQRKLLAKYYDNGFVYINGFRFPIFMSGSFVMLGAEKHPNKKEIVKALRNFK